MLAQPEANPHAHSHPHHPDPSGPPSCLDQHWECGYQWTIKMAADHMQQGHEQLVAILLACNPRFKRPVTGFTGKTCMELMTSAPTWIPQILPGHAELQQILTSWSQIAWLLEVYAACNPTEEDVAAFQARGTEHMHHMLQFRSSHLSDQLTTDMQHADAAPAADAPATTAQDKDCKYRFIPYDKFLCCIAHNSLGPVQKLWGLLSCQL